MLDYLTLGAVSLHSTSGPRNATHIEGLIGPPGARGDAYNRPEQDGGVQPFRGYMPPRVVVFEGETWAGATVDAVWQDWLLLAAAFEAALTSDTPLKWRHLGGSVDLQQNCRLADASTPVLDQDSQGAFVSYQVTLRCADPRWESQVASSVSTGAPSSSGGMPLPLVFPIPWGSASVGGSVIVTNNGTSTAWPIITVQGPASGPVVTCSTQGKFLSFDSLVLGSSDVLTIDTHPSSRSATVNGFSVLGSLRWLDSSFFGLRPGVAETIAFTALGGGTSAGSLLSVLKRDTYLG